MVKQKQKNKIFRIEGQVLNRKDQKGVPGLRVEAWDKDPVIDDLLGSAKTDENGRFTLSFDETYYQEICFDRKPDVYFKVFDKGKLIKSTEDSVLWNVKSGKTKISIEVDIYQNTEASYIVKGQLNQSDGRPLPGLLIHAVDKDLRHEQQLGEAATDSEGRYEISYSANQFRRAEKKQADLVIKVLDQKGKEIAKSDIVFNAEPDQTIDLTLQPSQYRGLSEWETYLMALAPVLEKVTVKDLLEEDISFINGETGILAEHLRFLRLDAQWSHQHDVDQAVFYGLLRQGLPMEYRRMLAEKPSRLRETLKASIEKNIIPITLEAKIEVILERLHELAVDVSFEQDDEAATPPLGLLLSTAPGLTVEQQRQFVSFTLRYDGNGDFWEQAREDMGNEAAIRAVQFSLQSSVLTLNHLPVLQQVQEEIPTRSVKTVAGWSEADWHGLVERASAHGEPLPPGFENTGDYVHAILQNVETYLPSDRLFARAQRTAQDLPVEAGSHLFNLYGHLGLEAIFNDPDLEDHTKEAQIRQKIQQFDNFRQSNPALDLRYADFLQDQIYVQGEAVEIDWSNIPDADRAQIRNQARAFQRLMPIANDTPTRLKLLSAGYDSSYKVVRTTTWKLANDMELPPEMVEAFRQAARNQVMRIELARYGIGSTIYDTPFRVNNMNPDIPENFRDLVDIEQLFGTQSFCDCPHCNSVLSQSAYFVDLMAFVDEHILQNESIFGPDGDSRRQSPLYLPNRRPDLWQLELSCKNIHTQIPYLQVVNHTFEEFLIRHLGVRDRDALYQHLAEARSTFSQPFLPALEELRLYLSHFRLTQADIYRVLGRAAAYRLAYLRVAPVELEIIRQADADAARVRRLYGLNVHDPIEIPMTGFIQVTGLERKAVTQLLCAGTLTGHALRVERTTVPDSLGQQFEEKITSRDAACAVADLDRIHRWIRLWRKTGWTLPAFDFVLGRLHQPGLSTIIDEAVVHRLADLKNLQDRLKLSLEELVSLFHLVPAPSEPSDPGALFFEERGVLYHRLFGDEPFSAGPVVFHAFEAEQPVVELPYPDAYRLLAGLSLSESELIELLIQLRHDLDITGAGTDRTMALTIENISLLYRHAVLARKLTRSLSEFFTLVRLVLGPDRAALTTLQEILQLIETVSEVGDLPFSVVELGWLALDEGYEALRLQVTDEQLEELRKQLPEMDEDGLSFTLGNIFRWEQEASKQLLHLAGVTLSALQGAAAGSDGELRNLVKRLEKWHVLQDNLEFKVEHLRFIRNNPVIFGDPTAPDLPLIHHLALYRSIISPEHVELETAHTVLLAFDPAMMEELKRNLSQILESEPDLVISLLAVDVMNLPTQTLEAIAQVRRAIVLCQKIGVNGTALDQIAASDYATLQKGRDAVLGAFQARYPEEEKRRELLEPYVDEMLGLRRDGLVDFLLSPAFTETEPNIRLRDTLDLYRFFLMDPEMEGCARTSWVLAGISSLQLYVHRCLMNLEQDSRGAVHFPPSAIPREEWEWRQSYRVWEANRKIFLYPENYLDPDLRDDKTPFFEELEDELQQQEITAESAKIAYKNYVDKFLKVANMKYAGAYRGVSNDPLYLFAHTLEDPPQYYYRSLTSGIWSPWYPINLAINAPVVSPIIYQGKLYVFWVEIQTRQINELMDGRSIFRGYTHSIYVNFSYQNASGQWVAKTKVKLRVALEEVESVHGNLLRELFEAVAEGNNDAIRDISARLIDVNEWVGFYESVYTRRIHASAKDAHTLTGYEWDRIYPRISHGELRFYYRDSMDLNRDITDRSFFHKISFLNKTVLQTDESFSGPFGGFGAGLYLEKTRHAENSSEGGLIELVHDAFDPMDFSILAINSGLYDFIASIEADSFLLEPLYYSPPYAFSTRRLGTTVAEVLGAILHERGLDKMLSIETQFNHPESIEPWDGSDVVRFQAETRHIDFEGACGNYYRELYFHIPFLIANNLNANQKFAEARRWYHYIFDPTASESPLDEHPEDRNWRYAPFRFQNIQKLRKMLTDEAALEQYRTDPFNPWAIARLRPGAFMKAIVMKYIDNLLDWGDHLFMQDTYESINEATLLYLTALDILGERPVELGKCSVPEQINYEQVAEELAGESDFIVLENLMPTLNPEIAQEFSRQTYRYNGTFRIDPANYAGFREQYKANIALASEHTVASSGNSYAMKTIISARRSASGSVSKPKGRYIADVSWIRPVFCVPANEHLLAYWDRVEDRLLKIRNCMNIHGMRRSLALFEPPIDPMLLARAKAAGLTLEDVLHPEGRRPLYRFIVLIEKARSMTSTVQGFGSALLSALEKKDAEELSLMRAKHEQNILNMTRQVKEKQIQEAQRQQQSLEESQRNINKRITYYTNLIETGLITWERTQQVALHTATVFTIKESVFRILSAISHLVPEVGSPFSMKFGGKQVGDSLSTTSDSFGAIARQMSAISSSAGLEAGNQRRAEEWTFQLETAEQELRQISQQIEAARLREEIAQRDLDIFEKNVEQNKEQYEFVRDKFTRLGLYNWMAQHLTRIYRQAYLIAYDMGKLAEQAYHFETGDESNFFIDQTHWAQDKAGLLAGERLMLQLQQLEQSYLTTNEREREITKHISLSMLSPEQLVWLRENGSCDIHIPEILFDLDFPGHYYRRIKAVSLTIPCVTGPYTSVSATLRLESSRTRTSIERTTEENYAYKPVGDAGDDRFAVDPVPQQAISTSTAQSDSGVFELNFRDERYLPFEGAGAISTWRLELSGKWLGENESGDPVVVDLRQFDFDTISDVIINISYTAKEANDDGTFKKAVIRNLQSEINKMVGTLETEGSGLYRLLSLRQEFSTQFHRFLHPKTAEISHETSLTIEKSHFPYFLQNRGLTVQEIHVVVKPKNKNDRTHFDGHYLQLARAPLPPSEAASLGESMKVDTAVDNPDWGGLPAATFSSLTGSPGGEWALRLDPAALPKEPVGITIDVDGQRRLNPDVIEDIFLVLRYVVGGVS
jgi:hypothetical protein